MDVLVVDHPLARARLSTMRDARTDNASFRAALRDLTLMLIYEATRDAPEATVPLHTPVARTTGYRLANPPLLVPVLRAGLGMVDAAQALMPEAQTGFVGIARNEETHQPMPYMESLPESLAGRPVFVLDPMLATGGSMAHTIGLLVERGSSDVTAICVLAAPEGVGRLRESGLPVRVVTASIDERLNDSAYIVPGLGDAGDRLFGAVKTQPVSTARTASSHRSSALDGRNPRSCSATQPCTVVQRVSDTSAVSVSWRSAFSSTARRAAARSGPSAVPATVRRAASADSSVGPENMSANWCGSSRA